MTLLTPLLSKQSVMASSDTDAGELELSSEDEQHHPTSTCEHGSVGRIVAEDIDEEWVDKNTAIPVPVPVEEALEEKHEDEDEGNDEDGEQAHGRRRGRRHRRRKGGADELDESEDEKTEERIVAEKVLRVFVSKTIGLLDRASAAASSSSDPAAASAATTATPPVDLSSPTSATLTTPLPASALLLVDPSALGDGSAIDADEQQAAKAIVSTRDGRNAFATIFSSLSPTFHASRLPRSLFFSFSPDPLAHALPGSAAAAQSPPPASSSLTLSRASFSALCALTTLFLDAAHAAHHIEPAVFVANVAHQVVRQPAAHSASTFASTAPVPASVQPKATPAVSPSDDVMRKEEMEQDSGARPMTLLAALSLHPLLRDSRFYSSALFASLHHAFATDVCLHDLLLWNMKGDGVGAPMIARAALTHRALLPRAHVAAVQELTNKPQHFIAALPLQRPPRQLACLAVRGMKDAATLVNRSLVEAKDWTVEKLVRDIPDGVPRMHDTRSGAEISEFRERSSVVQLTTRRPPPSSPQLASAYTWLSISWHARNNKLSDEKRLENARRYLHWSVRVTQRISLELGYTTPLCMVVWGDFNIDISFIPSSSLPSDLSILAYTLAPHRERCSKMRNAANKRIDHIGIYRPSNSMRFDLLNLRAVDLDGINPHPAMSNHDPIVCTLAMALSHCAHCNSPLALDVAVACEGCKEWLCKPHVPYWDMDLCADCKAAVQRDDGQVVDLCQSCEQLWSNAVGQTPYCPTCAMKEGCQACPQCNKFVDVDEIESCCRYCDRLRCRQCMEAALSTERCADCEGRACADCSDTCRATVCPRCAEVQCFIRGATDWNIGMSLVTAG